MAWEEKIYVIKFNSSIQIYKKIILIKNIKWNTLKMISKF